MGSAAVLAGFVSESAMPVRKQTDRARTQRRCKFLQLASGMLASMVLVHCTADSVR